MKRISAVYVGKDQCDECRVFELNLKTNYFEMLSDRQIKYKKEYVEDHEDFLVFKIEDDKATLINE